MGRGGGRLASKSSVSEGRSIAVGINNTELTLGRFQSIIFAELDGPRRREISIQVIGE